MDENWQQQLFFSRPVFIVKSASGGFLIQNRHSAIANLQLIKSRQLKNFRLWRRAFPFEVLKLVHFLVILEAAKYRYKIKVSS
jgi:hypothetical protein